MEPEQLQVGIGFIAFGSLISAALIYLRLGYAKWWWAMPSSVHAPGGVIYWGTPAALMFILMGIAVMLPDSQAKENLICVGAMYVPFMFIFLIWQPRFLTPTWLNWLKDNYGDIMPLLEKGAEASYKNGTIKTWEAQLETQEGLEAWALEVRSKYERLYPHQWKFAQHNSRLKEDLIHTIILAPEVLNTQPDQDELISEQLPLIPRQSSRKLSLLTRFGLGFIAFISLLLPILWVRNRKRT